MLDYTLDFDSLVDDVQACRLCPRMQGCTRVLSRANGNLASVVMFVGEAPGRLGADRTSIPFHGDKSGDNFEKLLGYAELDRKDIFVSNAVLCNPKDNAGNNIAPGRRELEACVGFLERQINLMQPKVVVTLGGSALEASRLIENHQLTLSANVRTVHNWYGRKLVPLYHPGARAMIHRSLVNQTADYYFVGETIRRLDQQRPRTRGRKNEHTQSWAIVEDILHRCGAISLFRLHKILYLLDVAVREEKGVPATSFYYVRQKDGPYCVELGGNWYHRFAALSVSKGRLPILRMAPRSLFEPSHPDIDHEILESISKIIDSISTIDDSRLKTKAYLTRPMKTLLRMEKTGRSALNYPLFDIRF